SVHVSLAYRCWNSLWSHEENQRRYGSLASPEGVGGNWRIEIGRDDENEAAFDTELARLKGLVDHRCLFTDLEEFRTAPSTLENVTYFLGQNLFGRSDQWAFLTVHENERLACTIGKDLSLTLQLKIQNLTLTLEGSRD